MSHAPPRSGFGQKKNFSFMSQKKNHVDGNDHVHAAPGAGSELATGG